MVGVLKQAPDDEPLSLTVQLGRRSQILCQQPTSSPDSSSQGAQDACKLWWLLKSRVIALEPDREGSAEA